jgi:hypothetical protein
MHGELLEMPSEVLRLSHPFELLETGNWGQWQSAYFIQNRKKPFKQIFRELYLLTEAERLEKTKSSPYAGHQVNQNHSRALLGARAWVSPFDDDARRTLLRKALPRLARAVMVIRSCRV